MLPLAAKIIETTLQFHRMLTAVNILEQHGFHVGLIIHIDNSLLMIDIRLAPKRIRMT